MSFLLSIEGMLASCFLVGLAAGAAMPKRWKTAGWGVTALAAAFAAVHVAVAGTPLTDVLYAALWAALGAFPGAAGGSWIRRRVSRSA